ncbi:hypothetical protein ONS95_008230 [Cadophora gregata]|uniref:uncharacterized protein n=1 Tax=Cadophora gregata TaxID=51156 RepID=UPI0026DC8A3D|nr:uncharacterized protein ONS95_008230 [Cadophora gregata]KAK0100270.1 hypothetical protein ONS96_007553 [Cadophora gregata f. sp. sojae]KAK0126646.1 hypothetical protein ONS95_008230 [Cadophora gregata]
MGWFDGVSEIGSSSGHHHRKSSKHHSSHGSPRASSIFGGGDHRHNSSRSSFFGFNPSHRSSSSFYKRSPRHGYLSRMYHKLRRLLRDLVYYMKKHPMKVFILVIMPLITGGALTGLLAKFGIRLPAGIERMFGMAGGAGGYGGSGGFGGSGYGVSRGRDGGMQFERTHVEGSGSLGALSGLGSVLGGMGGVGGAVSLAKMFM